MKKEERYVKCEFCDALMSTQSPPPTEQYENAAIHLPEHSSMLLPERHVTPAGRRVVELGGRYCGPMCLMNAIRGVFGLPPER